MFKVVQKFGGTSVSDIAKIRKVAEIICIEKKRGSSVVAVVSAMSGVTDQLVGYTKDITSLSDPESLAENDVVVASGEQISAGLLALALQSLGIYARSFLGWQLPIVTDNSYCNGRIMSVGTHQIMDVLKKNGVPVICGFQGVFNERIVTLGRGGSDTTAAAVASAIGANRCDIFTDVEGVFTADPRIVPRAHKIPTISYNDMLNMSSSGAKVIHPRAVDIVSRHNIETQVLSSFIDVPGTILVKENRGLERGAIIAVVSDSNIFLLNLKLIANDNKMIEALFGSFTDHAIQADIVGNVSDGSAFSLRFTISKSNYDIVDGIIKSCPFIEESCINADISKITVIGNGLADNTVISQKIFQILEFHSIKILSINAIDTKISILVSTIDKVVATQSLHFGLGLDSSPT